MAICIADAETGMLIYAIVNKLFFKALQMEFLLINSLSHLSVILGTFGLSLEQIAILCNLLFCPFPSLAMVMVIV